MAEKTLFEKIRDEEIPAEIVHRDDHCIAFKDIAPLAPTHLLIVPNKPIPRIAETTPEDASLIGHMVLTATELARKEGIDSSGYRLVINNGPDGGEAVPHLHLHLMGGQELKVPIG